MVQTRSLPDELTIYTVGEQRSMWLSWLADAADDRDMHVDAAAVDQVDAAGLQLLASLAHALTRQQRRLCLDQPSATLSSACRSLGMMALLAGADAPGGEAVR